MRNTELTDSDESNQNSTVTDSLAEGPVVPNIDVETISLSLVAPSQLVIDSSVAANESGVAANESGVISLSIELETVESINFASAQNGVAIIKKLVLKNEGEKSVETLQVHISTYPKVAHKISINVDRVSHGDTVSLDTHSLKLDNEFLDLLNEAVNGELRVSVEVADADSICATRPIRILPRDEWSGLGDMAHLLPAFVSPNDPMVSGLIRAASDILQQGGQNHALDGYASNDPARAWSLTAALWSAATNLGLAYAQPPASFEHTGQKIRGPGRISSEGLATCLDSTLLLAAALEAIGLNPVVLFAEGHAWLGVWLVDRGFEQLSEPDVVAVRKVVQLRELLVFETTLITTNPVAVFTQAIESGKARFAEAREHEFLMAIDIQRARAARILPLSSYQLPAIEEQEFESTEQTSLPPMPRDEDIPDRPLEPESQTSRGRIEGWQRELLQLNMKNPLLNFKTGRKSLDIASADLVALNVALAERRRFQLFSLSDDVFLGARNLPPEEQRIAQDVAIRDAFDNDRLAIPHSGAEVRDRIRKLLVQTKKDLQEGGSSTLFLAVGFLRIKNEKQPEGAYRAPLLLIPVDIMSVARSEVISIEYREDEVRFNETLLEYLEQEFGLTIPALHGKLTERNGCVDVQMIFSQVRQAVRDTPRVEVVEEAALSNFSFAKYLMWKDLVDSSEHLCNNRLVNHLVHSPSSPFPQPTTPAIEPDELDEKHETRDCLTPLTADSSQLAAIAAAAEGRDFVLIGPPGTGKSQTIANMIAQCLGMGKKVLFVAEKAAALDVVHRRLKANGLGDAVLELHSNKTDRKEFISQLARSWNRKSTENGDEWIQLADELQVSREKLNEYVDALHFQYPQGFSIYDAIGEVATAPTGEKICFGSMNAHEEHSYARLITLAKRLGDVHKEVRLNPPLSMIDVDDWSHGWQATLLDKAESLYQITCELNDKLASVSGKFGLEADLQGTQTRLNSLQKLIEFTPSEIREINGVKSLNIPTLEKGLDKMIADTDGLEVASRMTKAYYEASTIKDMPIQKITQDWRSAQEKVWPSSKLAKHKIKSLLQSYASSGDADPMVDLVALGIMQKRLLALDENPVSKLGGKDCNPEFARVLVAKAIEYKCAVEQLRQQVGNRDHFDSVVGTLESRVNEPLDRELYELRTLATSMEVATSKFEAAGGCVCRDESLKVTIEMMKTLIDNQGLLLDWTKWKKARGEAVEAGLGTLVEMIEGGAVEGESVDIFRQGYARWWLPLALDASPVLREFTDWEHDRQIETFRKLDDKAVAASAAEIMRRIHHNLPAQDKVARNSELATLLHLMSQRRPGMSIRKIIESMPEEFPKLAPCLLMSPLSIAQYLPTKSAAYDLVIFDEASQITTWDAIGAIARGRQTIIVGDPKQMPPTNFFGRSDEEEDEDEDPSLVMNKDLPSILDEACAAGLPTRRLDWHYRSRDEALIAFSNHQYYDGGLVTFPALSRTSNALQFHSVDGVYGKGGAGTNMDEARQIVEFVCHKLDEWLLLPEDKRPTLGVITFNIKQQSLIEQLLVESCQDNDQYGWFFDDAREEALIVKNLENIQGDERDVMLFSITFGPDIRGRLSMNFGALNKDGGEKRLNVAVTRARCELHVFSSLNADSIDTKRSSSQGVSDLKLFLRYAERGIEVLNTEESESVKRTEHLFEKAVADALRARNWGVQTQVGLGSLRIDLGVVNPDHPDDYLAGIECDGATYRASATARDRDKVRHSVLANGLGWNMFRIWSTDWFRDPEKVVADLHTELEKLLETDRLSRPVEKPTDELGLAEHEIEPCEPDLPALPADKFNGYPIPGSLDLSCGTGKHDLSLGDSEISAELPNILENEGEVSFCTDRSNLFATNVTSKLAGQPTATVKVMPEPDQDRFFDDEYGAVLSNQIVAIVDESGPLTLRNLARAVTKQHGWERTGRNITARVKVCMGGVERHKEFGVTFVWPSGSRSDRVPFRGLQGRAIREISRSEIADVLHLHVDARHTEHDQMRALADKLGIGRLSQDARAHLSECIRWWLALEENSDGNR